MITPERLREVFHYDQDTGVFIWKIKTGHKVVPGTVAGTVNPKGYIIIGVDTGRYKAHRLAWLYVHGVWPDRDIDHKNEDKGDNRISNLRDATRSLNVHNRQDTWAKTGRRGVYGTKRGKPYEVKINIEGVTHRIGRYDDLDEASQAYADAKKCLTGIDTKRTLNSARNSV